MPMTSVSRSGWRNPKVLSVLSLVYLCGVITGVLLIRFAVPPSPSSHGVGRYWGAGGREISLQKWKRELDLTPEQAAQIETVLDDFVMYYDTLQAQMDEVRTSGKGKIEQILNPQQREKFDKMLLEFQSKQIR